MYFKFFISQQVPLLHRLYGTKKQNIANAPYPNAAYVPALLAIIVAFVNDQMIVMRPRASMKLYFVVNPNASMRECDL